MILIMRKLLFLIRFKTVAEYRDKVKVSVVGKQSDQLLVLDMPNIIIANEYLNSLINILIWMESVTVKTSMPEQLNLSITDREF